MQAPGHNNEDGTIIVHWIEVTGFYSAQEKCTHGK